MADKTFTAVNYDAQSPIDGATTSLSLFAPPKSDIYAVPSPKEAYFFDAPMAVRKIAKAGFVSAKVTVSALWKAQFDQGGLIFVIPALSNPRPDAKNAITRAAHPGWVKAGIETNDGVPCLSVVGKSRAGWSEWGLVPLDAVAGEVSDATFEFTRDDNALVVWLFKRDTKYMIRQVPWVFLDEADLGEDVLLGVYAAQPDPNDISGGKSLQVNFSNLAIVSK